MGSCASTASTAPNQGISTQPSEEDISFSKQKYDVNNFVKDTVTSRNTHRLVRQISVSISCAHPSMIDRLSELSNMDEMIKYFPDGMAIINHKNIIVACNDAILKKFNKTKLIGKPISTIISMSSHQFKKIKVGYSKDFGSDTNTEKSQTQTFIYRYESMHLEVSYGRTKMHQKDRCYGYLISFRDITIKQNYIELLSHLLPKQIMHKIEKGEEIKNTKHQCVTIGFCDIVGFTQLTSDYPDKIADIITELFDKFDEYAKILGVTKIQRIGDSYMAACGLFEETNHTDKMIALMSHGIQYAKNKMNLQLRVGIHCGSVTSCLVGKELPQFSLFGPNVIIASRLESSGAPEKIHISEDGVKLIDATKYQICDNGTPNLKGLGTRYKTYLLVPFEI